MGVDGISGKICKGSQSRKGPMPDCYRPFRPFVHINLVERVPDNVQATPKVADDIRASFDVDKDGVFRTTTYRPNLRLEAKSFKSGVEKEADVKDFLKKNPGPSIIYVHTHDQTKDLCEGLKRAGFNAQSYHGGMANDVRIKVQEEFMASSRIVVSAPKSVTLVQ